MSECSPWFMSLYRKSTTSVQASTHNAPGVCPGQASSTATASPPWLTSTTPVAAVVSRTATASSRVPCRLITTGITTRSRYNTPLYQPSHHCIITRVPITHLYHDTIVVHYHHTLLIPSHLQLLNSRLDFKMYNNND